MNYKKEKAAWTYYRRTIREYKKKNSDGKFIIEQNNLLPVIWDYVKEAGELDPHYFLQDLTMAKDIIALKPNVHYDIGSRVDGFIAHLLSANVIDKVIMIDVRPLSVDISGLDFIQADATNLDTIADNSLESLSSLHAIEHFGLGRYGDAINPDGWRDALHAMQRKVKRGGRLFLSVPVGPQNKLCFNAHRIFAPKTIVEELDKMEIESFRYIHAMKVYDVNKENFANLDDQVQEYDCGLFVFIKK